MSKKDELLKILTLVVFLSISALGLGQVTPSNRVLPDTTAIDTTIMDTIIIRKTQYKVDYIPRGVHLTNPVISFNRTKALTEKPKRFRVPSFWTKENTLGIDVSEVAFVNWNAGGDNSVSALGKIKFVRDYKFRYFKWDNSLDLRYGLNAQEGRKLRKTEDVIRFSSNVGYRRDTLTNWYYGMQLNFNTQFSNGYKYPDRQTPISRFMAPGYLFLGIGVAYITPDKKSNLYLSPITLKATFVRDQELANKGAFGVERAVYDTNGNIITPGETHKTELGFLLSHKWDCNVATNVELKSRLDLYTDYLHSFGNIDVDWELTFKLRVNKYILTTLGTHIIYDDDIHFNEIVDDNGVVLDPGEPKIQFKQILAVGILYDF